MNKYIILDASALLAMLNLELGSELVESLLPSSVMSTVNVIEVIAELDKKLGITPEQGKEIVKTSINKIWLLDFEQAVEAGKLKKLTQHLGLSLGDRACLALALATGYPIYTADKTWSKLEIPCQINQIR